MVNMEILHILFMKFGLKRNNYAWISDFNFYSICDNTIHLCEDK